MIKKSAFKSIVFGLVILLTITQKTIAQKVNIVATPSTARIYVDGRIKGTGSYTVSVGKKTA